MTALTLRKIPLGVEKAIQRKAAKDHISLNKAVVEMLKESVMGKETSKAPRYHDLDWMCGISTEKNPAAVSKHLAEIRIIDKELWK